MRHPHSPSLSTLVACMATAFFLVATVFIGSAGVLADCQIVGAGCITVHGKFFEKSSPGIIGPRQLMVTSGGAIVAAVAQNPELTQFGKEIPTTTDFQGEIYLRK